MNTLNNIVQLEDPLDINSNNSKPVKKQSFKTTKPKTTKLPTNKNELSGYLSDIETPIEISITKPKKKLLRKKRTPKLNTKHNLNTSSNLTKKVGKLSTSKRVKPLKKLIKKTKVNFKNLNKPSRTKKSTKRRLHNIENSLNHTSGYETEEEEDEFLMKSNQELPNIHLNNPFQHMTNIKNEPVKILKPLSTTKSMTKSFVYQSKLQNGKLTEEGEYAINNNTKPYYIEGHIKDGKITEKMVMK